VDESNNGLDPVEITHIMGDELAKTARVAVFATCMVDIAGHSVLKATEDVLEAIGVETVLPEGQSCCGQPALNSGYPGPAVKLAKHWIRTFEPYDVVISPAGSCVAMVHHHFPRILQGGWRERAIEISRRTFEFTQFLVARQDRLELLLNETVTYHDSCHMKRFLGESSAPREVLSWIKGLQLVEMEGADTCCGFGGTFSVKFPEVSVEMGRLKLDLASRTKARLIISADPGCLMHLEGVARAQGSGLRAMHIAELLALAMQTEDNYSHRSLSAEE
jgi:Fe-S oxidoreductase